VADTYYYHIGWGVLLLAFVGSVILLVLRDRVSPAWRVLDGSLAFFAGVMALWLLARRFPLQNVAAVGLIILGTSALVTAVFARGADPDRTFKFAEGFGPGLMSGNKRLLLPWHIPFLVLALAAVSRETTRLILRPWRRERNYGLWLLGISSLLVMLAGLAVEPFALHVGKWWVWHQGATIASWLGVPWFAFVGWFCLAALVLAFAGPWFVVKRPWLQPPDLASLALWLLILLYFTIGNALGRAWPAVAAAVVSAGVVSFFAWRGWRLSQPPLNLAPAAPSSGAAA